MLLLRRLSGALAALGTLLVLAGPAVAGPVATSDPLYTALGRVFPDPLAGCQVAGTAPCDPAAEGNVPARTFVGIDEFHDALAYMNSKPEWQRYMEVDVLDGRDGAGSATRQEVEADPSIMFPGDDQHRLEFTPRPDAVSAGLPTTTLDRERSDLIVVRVTDETVPDAGKRRMALSLSIHGIERAGAEGGIRAMEDLVTAASSGRDGQPILPASVKKGAPTFAEALRHTVVYFTFPNPDGWRRGSVNQGRPDFQRYNGNGVDPNRDYLDVGYNFRGYSGDSEPETRAFKAFYRDLLDQGMTFAAGDDLHGQPEADALSYTLLPHGQHDLGKDTRIRETALRINRAQYEATKWSPIIQDNDQPVGGGAPCVPGVATGDTCAKVYAQTWGSVYDTINYTTTGTLGDWFDSKAGLNADGIDNEMSFSHIDKHTAFEPETEQLHVDGNRAIIFAHLSEILDPRSARMVPPGPGGYVASPRIAEAGGTRQADAPAGTAPQADLDLLGTPDPQDGSGRVVVPFEVQRGPQGDGTDVFDGGMRVDVTTPNLQGVSTGVAHLSIECRHCDDHVGAPDSGSDWIVVAEDFNQSPIYLQAGVTAAVNLPDATWRDPATGKDQPVEWRAVVDLAPLGLIGAGSPGPSRVHVHFTSGPASADGNSGGDAAPRQAAVDVANTDFLADLNRFIDDPARRFRAIDPRRVIAGAQHLDGLANLVLADAVLPGNGGYTAAERAAWIAALHDYVAGGGHLVLTDGALKGLADLFDIPSSRIRVSPVYAGQVTFDRCADYTASSCASESTLDDPLNRGVALPGSRFNTGDRRQLYEPTPLGFAIQDGSGGDASHARQWQVQARSFAAAGGRVSATSADSSPRSTAPVLTQATMGEIPLGAGHVRIAGALLPQPETAFDHPLGLAPYAVTYTGYILACNLLDAQCPVVAAGAG